MVKFVRPLGGVCVRSTYGCATHYVYVAQADTHTHTPAAALPRGRSVATYGQLRNCLLLLAYRLANCLADRAKVWPAMASESPPQSTSETASRNPRRAAPRRAALAGRDKWLSMLA